MGILDKVEAFIENPSKKTWKKVTQGLSEEWAVAKANAVHYAKEPFAQVADLISGNYNTGKEQRAGKHTLSIGIIRGAHTINAGVSDVKAGAKKVFRGAVKEFKDIPHTLPPGQRKKNTGTKFRDALKEGKRKVKKGLGL